MTLETWFCGLVSQSDSLSTGEMSFTSLVIAGFPSLPVVFLISVSMLGPHCTGRAGAPGAAGD